MNAAALFAGVFLIFVVFTVVVPGLPPGELVFVAFGFPQATGSFLGVSVSILLYGAVNGFIYGLVAAAAFGLASRGTKRKPLSPVPRAREFSSSPPRPTPVYERAAIIPPAVTVRRGRFGVEKDVKTIEGIGSWRGGLLYGMGVRTVGDLLRVGGTREGRQRIARRVGVSYGMVLGWVRRGDLLRVRGVGKQYSELLESAGVCSVRDLAGRNGRFLWQILRGVNAERGLVRRVPPRGTVEMWVYNAKRLEPLVV